MILLCLKPVVQTIHRNRFPLLHSTGNFEGYFSPGIYNTAGDTRVYVLPLD